MWIPTCNGITAGMHNASRAFLAWSEGSSVITILQRCVNNHTVSVESQYTHTHTHMSVCMCEYIYKFVRMYVNIFICNVCKSIFICMYANIYVYMYVRMHTFPFNSSQQSYIFWAYRLEDIPQSFNHMQRIISRKLECTFSNHCPLVYLKEMI